MLFNDLSYYLFLVVVLGLFHALPWRQARWMLVVASYTFYGAAEPWYCLILAFSTSVDYVAARRIFALGDSPTRKYWLGASLLLNLGVLAAFKYVDFATSNLNVLLSLADLDALPYLRWVLPVGISFYTFQTLSYTIDVYRGRVTPTRDLGQFALYVSFFPQLVAGPIERAGKLLPQLVTRQPVTGEDLAVGVERILWGLMKKTVFADRLAIMVSQVYANPAAYSSPELLVATAAFAFQLYLDFSAYTDIAIGSARLMGIRLSENFNYPFLARTPSDFWARWHITLTSWFRDYVYYPLGGTRRRAPLRTGAAVLGVMGLMGLWHGAEWHYVAFGLVSAAVLLAHLALRVGTRRKQLLGDYPWSPLLAVVIGNAVIFGIMVFFRAQDLPTAWAVFHGIAVNGPGWHAHFNTAAVCLAIAWIAHVARGTGWHRRIGLEANRLPDSVRGLFWFALLAAVLFGAVDNAEKFVYFQF